MVLGALLTTLIVGAPLSSLLPFHESSAMRALPFASQGFPNVPGPVEPVGQSARGVSGAALAVALGVAATLVVGAAEAEGAAEAAAASVAFASSLQPTHASNANI